MQRHLEITVDPKQLPKCQHSEKYISNCDSTFETVFIILNHFRMNFAFQNNYGTKISSFFFQIISIQELEFHINLIYFFRILISLKVAFQTVFLILGPKEEVVR